MSQLNGRTQRRRGKSKGVWKINRRADFTGCLPGDSFRKGMKPPGF